MVIRALPFILFALLLGPLTGKAVAQSPTNLLFTDSDEDMDLGEGQSRQKEDTSAADKALKLRKLVQSATKGETTVQEAPAVITILTEDDLKDYGFRHILDALSFVPSILPANAQYDTMPIITTLGNSVSFLLVQDGISMLDPIFNVQATIRRWPMELVKRVEVMSSPGGVLWGANSFLGITSIITKDYNDVDGFQLGLGGGTGPGDQDVFRAYGMFGKDFGNFKLFTHLSGEFFRGPKYETLPMLLMTAPPQPPSTVIYSGNEAISSSAPMSFYGTFNGKLHYKKFMLMWNYPFIGFPGFSKKISRPLSLMSWPINNSSSVAGTRANAMNFLDRIVALKFKDRILDNKFGLDAKAYFTQFQRNFDPAVILPASNIYNGMTFKTTSVAQRAGLTLDFDYTFSNKRTRILFGAESFYEWLNGASFKIIAPLDAHGQVDFSTIPLSCPYEGSPVYDPNDPNNTTYVPGCSQPYIFDQSRLVMGTFASVQHKFKNNMILDAGLRVQTAPSGNVTYSPQLLPGASLVVPIRKNWFWKVNYLTGFRPPIFSNTGNNGRGIVYGGDENIDVESSQAIQTELNAVLIKNMGKIQELSLRLNYGYTILDNAIKINQGVYYNSGRRQIHAVEALARLYMRGGHSVYMSYSFNTNIISGEVDGMITRSVPNQWFTFASVFKLTKTVDFISSLKVIGSFEDPNRVMNLATNSAPSSWTNYEMVPSAGLLSAGFRFNTTLAGNRAEFSLMTYNLMDTRSYYTGDYFSDMAAFTETIPAKGQRFYFFANSKFYF